LVSPEASRRNPFIDRLRGLSIFLVLSGHSLRYIGWWAQEFPDWIKHQIITSAYYGVTIFFVISGYLITAKFVWPEDNRIYLDLRKFYVQRIGRIIPPLSLLLVVSFLLAVYLGAPVDPPSIVRGFAYLLQLSFGAAATLIPHVESSYDPLWSLAVEEAFYIFLPLVCLLAVTKSRLVVVLVIAFISGYFYRSEPKYIYSFFATFDQLALGGLLAVFAGKLRGAIPDVYLPPLRWLGLIGISTLCATTDATVDPHWVSLIALSAALYIVGSPDTQVSSRFPLRLVEAFGRLSYEIYLAHLVLFWAMAPWGVKLQVPISMLASRFAQIGIAPVMSTGAANLMLLFASLAVNLAVCFAIAKLYSEPINRAIRASMQDGIDGSEQSPVAVDHVHSEPA
jgi:peptidoglycan/LPS O-acetylase OafA/YrhL